MPYQTIGNGGTTITNSVTTVDCQKQVLSWRLLRSLIELLIPSCNGMCVEEQVINREDKSFQKYYYYSNHPLKPTSLTSSSPVTGTIFGFRRGKVSLCIQTNSKSTNPILLLEFALPTAILAREMQGGILRIALECSGSINNNSDKHSSLLSMPLWNMYCNGRRGGYAVKRRPSKVDIDALKIMNGVVVGAGIISGKQLDKEDDELLYLRASFARINSGSSDAESFHLNDPDGSIGQELSIFFFRSR